MLSILAYLLISPTSAHAALEFDTSYSSYYRVGEDGKSQVTHNISIKNKLANIYTTNYTISIGSTNLEDVTASDEEGTLTSEVSTTDNSTTIDLLISEPAIGKDQIKNITISYTNNDIALKNGRIWEINVPRLANANEIGSYTRTIEVPKSFNTPSIALPEPSSVSESDSTTIYTFVENKNSSITLFFGDTQYFSLNLKYQITNTTLKPADTEIALPPDTPYQRVILDSIAPSPKHIRIDQDGNWLAVYTLEPGETIDITADLFISVTAKPTLMIPDSLSEDFLTREQPFWSTTSDTIKSLAAQLNTPRKIYDYVVGNFVYSYERVYTNPERLGAVKAINNPSIAICTEFTDTFITLARASGIPAREINGFAYTNNPSLRPLSLERDILHAWPEYFDQESGQWIQIDPTWANTTGGIDYFTKLDFNHITFVRHGQESTYPFPAGSYKKSSSDKQIAVAFVEEIPELEFILTSNARFSSSNPFKTEKIVTVTNSGNSSAIDIEYETEDGDVLHIDYLPPLATEDFTVLSNFAINLQALPWTLIIIAIIPATILLFLLKRFRSKN